MKSDLPDHPHVHTIERYYEGCNAADAALISATLSADMVHYWVDHKPVEGGDNVSTFAAKTAARTKATWTLDHALVNGDEAVAEWSMTWTPIGLDTPELLRGTEWFRFRGGLIAEVRAYHCNYHLGDPQNFELRGFPYLARGYQDFE